jgi:hypothetical protein
MSPRIERSLALGRMTVLVALSLAALGALFVVSWAVFAPVVALLTAPLALGAATLFDSLPIATLNSGFALFGGAWLAVATVMAVVRILMRRARSRRRARP